MPQSALRQFTPQSAEPAVRSYNPFNPAFRETMRSSITDLLGGRTMGGTPSQRYKAGMADMLTGAVDFVPGVGEAVGAADTVQAARGGNYGTAAILGGATALGMVPVVGDAASKAIRGVLDMSQAARMQRAAEEGFDIDTTWFHGTPDSRGIIESGFSTKGGHGLGPDAPIFLTKSRKVAASYADPNRAWDYQNATPEVLPLRIRTTNPATINWGGGTFRTPSPDGKYKTIRQAIDDMKAKGHDSVIFENVVDDYRGKGPASTITAVFDPSNIRSVNAAFDPAKRESRNIMAGAAGGAVGLSALRGLQSEEQERKPD